MHTLDVPGAKARVFHNGDWSGDARIVLNPDSPQAREVLLPADVLLAIGEEAALKYIYGELAVKIEDKDTLHEVVDVLRTIRIPGSVRRTVPDGEPPQTDRDLKPENEPESRYFTCADCGQQTVEYFQIHDCDEFLRICIRCGGKRGIVKGSPGEAPPREQPDPRDEELFTRYMAARLVDQELPASQCARDALVAVAEHRKLFPLRTEPSPPQVLGALQTPWPQEEINVRRALGAAPTESTLQAAKRIIGERAQADAKAFGLEKEVGEHRVVRIGLQDQLQKLADALHIGPGADRCAVARMAMSILGAGAEERIDSAADRMKGRVEAAEQGRDEELAARQRAEQERDGAINLAKLALRCIGQAQGAAPIGGTVGGDVDASVMLSAVHTGFSTAASSPASILAAQVDWHPVIAHFNETMESLKKLSEEVAKALSAAQAARP